MSTAEKVVSTIEQSTMEQSNPATKSEPTDQSKDDGAGHETAGGQRGAKSGRENDETIPAGGESDGEAAKSRDENVKATKGGIVGDEDNESKASEVKSDGGEKAARAESVEEENGVKWARRRELVSRLPQLSHFKVLIIGDSSVGKTAFLLRYTENRFTNDFNATIGVDFRMRTLFRELKEIQLHVWDTAGQERFKNEIPPLYYRGANGFLLMYDVTNKKSFDAISKRLADIRTYTLEDNTSVVLVGNKCDLGEERVVTKEAGQNLGDELDTQFFETSCKEDLNVSDVFEALTNLMVENYCSTTDQYVVRELPKKKSGCPC